MEKNRYHTAGRERLLGLLAEHPERQMTVEELTRMLAQEQVAIGKSTVYRLVGRLCEEGKVRRLRDTARGCCVYAYAEDTRNCDGHHFHLKCLSCGRIFHLECRHSEALCEHIAGMHHFQVDSGRTMLYGRCEHCQKSGKETL